MMSPVSIHVSPPDQSVTRPPSSRTSAAPAATSQVPSPSSKKPSNVPAAVQARSSAAAPARRRSLDAFVAAHAERLGAQVGGSDSHFGRHDIARVVTAYEGAFRAAVVERSTRPRLGTRRAVPAGIAIRQQWRALVEVPLRRLRGQM